MRSTILRLCAIVAAFVFVAAACGDDDDSSADDGTTTTEQTDDLDPTDDAQADDAGTDDAVVDDSDDSDDSATGAGGLESTSDLEVVCTDGDGVSAAAPYTPADDGVPTIIFRSRGTDSYQWDSSLRGDWSVDLDTLDDVQLVGCLDESDTRATGEMCEGEIDGEAEEFEMFAVSYDLTVHDAQSADVVGTASLEAAELDCPMVAAIDSDTGGIRLTPSGDELETAMIEAIG